MDSKGRGGGRGPCRPLLRSGRRGEPVGTRPSRPTSAFTLARNRRCMWTGGGGAEGAGGMPAERPAEGRVVPSASSSCTVWAGPGQEWGWAEGRRQNRV